MALRKPVHVDQAHSTTDTLGGKQCILNKSHCNKKKGKTPQLSAQVPQEIELESVLPLSFTRIRPDAAGRFSR